MKKSLAAIASALAVTCACTAFAATPAPSADPAVVAATKQMLASMKIRDVMQASLKQADQQMPAQITASLNAMIDSDATLSADKKAEARLRTDRYLAATAAATDPVFGPVVLFGQGGVAG